MSKAEILAELGKLTPEERAEVRLKLVELDEHNSDIDALARADELAGGLVKPKTQAEIFRNVRAAVE